MRITLIIFTLIFVCFSPCKKVEIALGYDLKLRINHISFKPGLLRISKIADVLECKYKTKREKPPFVRYYYYHFKRVGITLISSSSSEPSDRCNSLIIRFRKKNKQVYKGTFSLLGQNIDWNTNFDDIFKNPKFKDIIDYSIYGESPRPRSYKNWIRLRFQGHVIWIKFNQEDQIVSEINIESLLLDPYYIDLKET